MRYSQIIYCLFVVMPLCFLLNACFPAEFLSRPAASGRLVDSTGKAIVNAKVTVRYDQFDQPLAVTQTNTDGKFTLPAAGERCGVYFLMQDNPHAPTFIVEYDAENKSSPIGTFRGNRVLPFGLGSREVRLADVCLDASAR